MYVRVREKLNSICFHFDRVRESRGKYAFIMESVTAEYYMRNAPCDLTTIGKLKEVKYALAVQQGQ